MTTAQKTAPAVIIIGEVLFDHFPDGKRVLGGAPFNVAWNLHGLGIETLFLSAVGEDQEGREIRDLMERWGMRTDGLSTTAQPTGRVVVSMQGGQPEYEISPDMAFDFIPPALEKITNLSGDSSQRLLYTGSLALRNQPSRDAIFELIHQSGLQRFVDINIRDPWFNEDYIDRLVGGATWLKMSDEELKRLARLNACDDRKSIEAGVEQLWRAHDVETFLITAGADGAYCLTRDSETIHVPAPKPPSMEDTVGAGDAFAAATLAGLVQKRPITEALASAVRFASRVCGLHGATTQDKSFYHLNDD